MFAARPGFMPAHAAETQRCWKKTERNSLIGLVSQRHFNYYYDDKCRLMMSPRDAVLVGTSTLMMQK